MLDHSLSDHELRVESGRNSSRISGIKGTAQSFTDFIRLTFNYSISVKCFSQKGSELEPFSYHVGVLQNTDVLKHCTAYRPT